MGLAAPGTMVLQGQRRGWQEERAAAISCLRWQERRDGEGSLRGQSADFTEDCAFFSFLRERLGLGTGEEGARLRGSQAYGGKCGEHPVIHRTQPGNELLCRGKHRWKRAAATPSQQHGNHRLVAF